MYMSTFSSYERYFQSFHYDRKKSKPKSKTPNKCNPFVEHFHDYVYLIQYNYTISDLKAILKRLKLPKCKKTKKNDILHYCTNILHLSCYVKKIQTMWRNHFIRKFNKTLGPSYRNFKVSNNMDDFLTTEDICDIDYYYFFSFRDVDNFVYTFHIVSIFSLIAKKMYTNPYNRNKFSSETIESIKTRMRYNRILNKTSDFEQYIPKTSDISDRIHQLFHHMDHLGNYTSNEWFTKLNSEKMRTFVYELYEIWNYRAQLTTQAREEICPPRGNPFVVLPRNFIQQYHNPRILYSHRFLQHACVNIMEKLAYSAHTDVNKNMGVLYILSALTLVSDEARNAMPWLYASVYHN